MTEDKLLEIENSIGLIDCPDCEQGRMGREGTFEDGQDYDRCETCDGSGMVSRFPDAHALIAALRQAWQERDIEAKAALACNDALVRERAALAAAQAERDALRQRFDTFRATRNREQDSYVQANHEFAAALTEARRVLREVEWAFDNGYDSEDACALCHQPRSTGHLSDCALAAVLAQEEK